MDPITLGCAIDPGDAGKLANFGGAFGLGVFQILINNAVCAKSALEALRTVTYQDLAVIDDREAQRSCGEILEHY